MHSLLKTGRRAFVASGLTVAAGLALLTQTPTAVAQTNWPAREVRIIAPFPAGAPADQIVRWSSIR